LYECDGPGGNLGPMTNTNPVHRYPTITPHLGVEDPAALDFYKRAFDAGTWPGRRHDDARVHQPLH
jgi:hypothetical protein